MNSSTTIMTMTEVVATLMTTPNVTDIGKPTNPHYIDELRLANRITLGCILAFIMIAMGCVISIKDIKTTCRHPVGVFVGFVSQFAVMPLLAFTLAHALRIKAAFAIGMLVIGCSPGGTVSNLFTYWTNGDVCLSVVMTTASVILAFGMMPLNLFIYSRSWTDENSVIPYKDIVITLLSILVPLMVGICIRYKLKRLAPFIVKLGSISGLLGIVVAVVLNGLIHPQMFTSGWKVWFASATMPFIGFSFGYGLARILKQSHKKCRTIAFETGSQNVALTLTLILLTFPDSPQFGDLMTFPSLFGIFTFVDALFCVSIYKIVIHFRKHRSQKFPLDNDVSGEEEEELENMMSKK